MRKQANVILMSLGALILIFILAAVFINIFMTYETMNRIIPVAEEAAQVRAMAVDVPLKEFAGIVEIMHPQGYLQTGMYEDNVDHGDIDRRFKENGTGHLPILNPYGEYDAENYAAHVEYAEKVAREAAVQKLRTSLGKNANGDLLATFDPDLDICFQIKPLPVSSGWEEFECKMGSGEVAKQRIYVEGENERSRGNIEVKNVAFVAIQMEFNHFIYGKLREWGWNGGVKQVTAISYPQVDVCYGVHC